MDFEIGGTVIPIRALKRKEVRALKKEGFNLYTIAPDQLDDLIDKVFEIILAPADVAAMDEMANRDAVQVFNAIFRESFGAPDKEKNS